MLSLRWAQEKFEKQFADVIAMIPEGVNEMYAKMAAEVRIHPELLNAVAELEKAEKSKAPEYRDLTSPVIVSAKLKQLCEIFLRLMGRGAFQFTGWTQEAIDQVQKIEEVAGLREQAPPPPPPKSNAELLEDQIVSDFNGGLSSSKFKRKLDTDKLYRETYIRLSQTDKLRTRATTLHDGNSFGLVGG